MLQEINDLLKDYRTHKMLETAGYSSVIYILEKFRSRLMNGDKLTKEEIKRVRQIEKDKETIEQHYVKMTVNGEEQDVLVYTTGIS